MIGAIIGDIVGSRFEFHNHRSKDFDLFTKDCRFTDDTVETIAIADSILNGQSYKDCLVRWCRKYPGAGFSGRFKAWIDNPEPYESFGNGALMRISPIGYARNKRFKSIELEAYKAVSCSHDTDIARDCASALTFGIIGALSGSKTEIVRQLGHLNMRIPSVEHLQKTNVFDASCQGTLPAAVACFVEAESFEDAIRNAVSIGGDTDTIANITGALAGAYFGVPQEFINKLKDYLPEEMIRIVDKFVIQFDAIPVPFWVDPTNGPIPEEYKFLETGTIFTR